MERRKVINSSISIGSYKKFISEIIKLSEQKESSYVCICNVHMLLEAKDSDRLNNIVNNAAITTPDGMPLVKAIKYIYGIDQERVAGMDLLPDLMKVCEKQKKTIFLYGSINEVLEKIILRAKSEYSNLTINYYSPPFRILKEKEKEEIVVKINSSNPDFLFVALGCPKQEKWMAEHEDKIKSCMIGLGGAFEVYANVKRRAPYWMQRNSLEWLFRLMSDPERLWRRYLKHNPRFIWYFCSQILRNRIKYYF